ncbi:MAG: hypothetical protein ACI89X_002326 [Planctomycetota bacterium]|jgi:hypothetical protein
MKVAVRVSSCNPSSAARPLRAMRRRNCWLALALTGCAVVGSSVERHQEYGWAKAVLLGTEVGDARDAVVRWPHSVHYLVVTVPARVRRAVDAAFAQLQETLQGSLKMDLEHIDGSDERIGRDGFVTVFAMAPRHAVDLAKRYGAQRPQPDADGWFTIVWNRSFELTRAVVFIDPGLTDKWLRHTALEEMFQALGPSNDSPTIHDSLLFESDTLAGSHDRLGRVDEQVLWLLYNGLQPGDGAVEIARAMQRLWVFADAVSDG